MAKKRETTVKKQRTAVAKPVRMKAPTPSGYLGVHRSRDGKHWSAFVYDPDLLCIGQNFDTPRQADQARSKYWAKRVTA
jgi:hypothetical protein